MIECQITADKSFTDTLQLTEEWPERTKAFTEEFLYKLVGAIRDDVERRVPSTSEWTPYRKSLRVRKVTGMAADEAAFLLFSNLRSRKVTQVDAPTTILYIQIRRRLRRVPPELRVLQRFSPWTYSTIPFVPDRRDARLLSRRVRRREQIRVEKMRNQETPKWRKELDKCGVRVTDQKRLETMRKGLQTVPDLAFEALRLEFGLGDGKGQSHWRPALHKVSQRVSGLLKLRELIGIISDPNARDWKKPESDSAKSVAASKLKRYEGFQKALRVHF